MKSKRNTYILIAALISIWGFIAFKMVFNFEKTKTFSTNIIEVKNNFKKLKIDSFTIAANYKDPFNVKSNKIYYPKKQITKKKKPIIKKKEANKKATKKINISHIKYYGTIKNSKTNKIAGILYVGKQEYLIYKNFEFPNGKILSISEEKISIEYKKQVFEIIK